MRGLPVADDWFSFMPVSATVTRIREPHADPWVAANAWHVRGATTDLLIDCGLGVASLRRVLKARFPDREPVVVLTHGHLDHMGSAHEFRRVWAHRLEPVDAPGRGTLSGPALLALLGADGGDDPPGPVLIDALPAAGYDVDAYALVPVTPTRLLDDGDRLDLGDRVLTVLHLPGHTPGSIALLDEQARTLFTGDAVYDPPHLLDDLHGSSRPHYARSMRRLLALQVEVVHAGHGDDFDGARLREIALAYLRTAATG